MSKVKSRTPLKRVNVDAKSIYAVGDIHGCFNTLVGMIKNYSIRDSIIICCGDCGLGFNTPEGDKQTMTKLNNVCKKNNVRVIMVRGNHDDPKFFEEGLANTKYITAVPDYTVINGNILCVGGATSIDRTHIILSTIQAAQSRKPGPTPGTRIGRTRPQSTMRMNSSPSRKTV